MNENELIKIMSEAVGNPDGGVVRDSIPAMAAAVAAVLSPKAAAKPEPEQRVVKPAETR